MKTKLLIIVIAVIILCTAGIATASALWGTDCNGGNHVQCTKDIARAKKTYDKNKKEYDKEQTNINNINAEIKELEDKKNDRITIQQSWKDKMDINNNDADIGRNKLQELGF